ncbi:transcriptional regulator [Candidatus Poribacteria bacterium]|nr:transcriptional regulator [Candidatus Poribacteria bacterium]
MREMGNWREYLMERLADPENAMNYLDVSLEEYQMDGDTDFFLIGLQNVVEAQGGVSTFAERIGLEQETLFELLSNGAAPRIDTFNTIVKALGCRLSIKPREDANPTHSIKNKDYSSAPPESVKSGIGVTTD